MCVCACVRDVRKRGREGGREEGRERVTERERARESGRCHSSRDGRSTRAGINAEKKR